MYPMVAVPGRFWVALSSLLIVSAVLVSGGMAEALPPETRLAEQGEVSETATQQAESDRLFREGRQFYNDAQYPAAIESWQQALAIIRTLGNNPYQEGNLLYSLGDAYRGLEQYAQALDFYQQALEMARTIGFTQGEGMCLERIGDIHAELGQYLSALQTYQQILRIEYSLTANHTSRGWNRIQDVFAEIYLDIHANPEAYAEEITAFEQLMDGLRNSREPELVGMTWRAIANDYTSQREYARAIERYQDAIAAFASIDNWDEQLNTIERLADLYRQQRQLTEAIALYEQTLEQSHHHLTPESEARILDELAQLYQLSGDGEREIASYQRILALIPEGEDADWGHIWGTTSRYRVNTWLNLGRAYERQGQPDRAQTAYAAALSIPRTAGDRPWELNLLRDIGAIHRQNHRYEIALEIYQQALVIAREILSGESDRPHSIEASLIGERGWGRRASLDLEIATLLDLSTLYQHLGQERMAQQVYQDALQRSRQLGGLEGEFVTVYHLAQIYDQQIYDSAKAIELYQQALTLARDLEDDRAKIYALLALGERYLISGPYTEAITAYEEAIALYEERGADLRTQVPGTGEREVLRAIALSYQRLGKYADAIHLYEQALETSESWNSTNYEVLILNELGASYRALGEYDRALQLQTQALDLAYQGAVGWSDFEEAVVLDSLGVTHQAMGENQTALTYHQQSVERFQGMAHSEAIGALNHLGLAYQALRQYEQAITLHEQALGLFQTLEHRTGEAATLSALGNAYGRLDQASQAITFYQQSLVMQQVIGDRAGEQRTLANLGRIFANQRNLELAIVFYKQSVNTSESIRRDLQTLSLDLQQSYANTVAETYRTLADLLLQQNRVLEAQQVLDLLRVQELDEYLQGVSRNAQTQNGIDLLAPELEIRNRTIAIGYELARLRAIPYTQLSDAERQRLEALITQQNSLIQDFRGFIQSPEIQTLLAQLSPEAQTQDVLAELDNFINLQRNLQALDQNAVLIYPLILEDRLELVLVTPFSEPTRYPVAVSRTELNTAIVEFRQALSNRTRDPRAAAQQLYDWLIAPMAEDLEAIAAETILYAPDGALRYVPLAALHDGDQWLIERFRINHITAASFQNFTLQPTTQPRILAAAFSDGFYEFQVGQRSFSFGGLPFAGIEVENLVAAFPGTTPFFNDTFSRQALEPAMDHHTIVHLATHAAFVPGAPRDSFILFGNGDRLTLQEIRDGWTGRFNQVELVVLSACETGLGGDTLGNGEEILGFGYLMQEAGAEAAIASLWAVNDGGTQVLMDAFYAALQTGYSKAEALQQAQLTLINGTEQFQDGDRGATASIVDLRTGQPLSQNRNLNHPYYWAPFILIGNGL